jgi:hypothetical protein
VVGGWVPPVKMLGWAKQRRSCSASPQCCLPCENATGTADARLLGCLIAAAHMQLHVVRLMACSVAHAAGQSGFVEWNATRSGGALKASMPQTQISRICKPEGAISACIVCDMQSYWPVHRSECRRNDFADVIEQQVREINRC